MTFGACGIWYDTLSKPKYIKLFQVLYYLSSFFGQVCVCPWWRRVVAGSALHFAGVSLVPLRVQWGPNATTWLLPSEMFPTEVRGFVSGFSAAAGKFGALAAGVTFSRLHTVITFHISAVCGIVGAVVTFLFIPDVTSLDLNELDRQWRKVRAGKAAEYTGPAADVQYLSYYEIWTRQCCRRKRAAASSDVV